MGDIVQLNSGGPLMTTGMIVGNDRECYWSEHGSIKTELFPTEGLRLATAPKAVECAIR